LHDSKSNGHWASIKEIEANVLFSCDVAIFKMTN